MIVGDMLFNGTSPNAGCYWPERQGVWTKQYGPCNANSQTLRKFHWTWSLDPPECISQQAVFGDSLGIDTACEWDFDELYPTVPNNRRFFTLWRQYTKPSGNDRSQVIVHYKKPSNSGEHPTPTNQPVRTYLPISPAVRPRPATQDHSPSPYRPGKYRMKDSLRERFEVKPDSSFKGDTPTRIKSRQKRPEKGTKEKKKSTREFNRSIFGRLLSFTTEAIEFVTYMWKAIDPEFHQNFLRWKHARYDPIRDEWTFEKPNPYEMAVDLWLYGSELDWDLALQGYLAEQVEDRVIGSLGSRSGKAHHEAYRNDPNGFFRREFGLTTGPAV